MTNVSDKPTSGTPGQVYARDLIPGQWVIRAGLNGSSPMRVLFRSDTDTDGDQSDQVVAVFKGNAYSFPVTLDPGAVFNLATDAQIEEHKNTARRLLIASQMRKLAALIESNASLPLGTYPSITFAHDLAPDDLARVAQIVGAEVARPYGTRLEVQFGSYDSFQATWSGKAADPVETAKMDAAALVDDLKADADLPLGHAYSTTLKGSGATCTVLVGDGVPAQCGQRRAAHGVHPRVAKAADAVRNRAAADQDDMNSRPAGADQ